MDGFEFIAALRASPVESIARVPVVVLTGTSDTKSVHRLRALGIAGYIVKPASPQAIAERVSAALRAPKREAPPVSAT
jgi:DNA-binding NarL/FixJ family response regulator